MVINLDTIRVENVQIYRENGTWKLGFNITLYGSNDYKAVAVSYKLEEQALQSVISFLKPFIQKLKNELNVPYGEEWSGI